MKHIHCLTLRIVFPVGVAPGDGGNYNVLRIARNGDGDAVLRGTSLAGVLRHAWADSGKSEDDVHAIFGFAATNDRDLDADGKDSPLKVSDCILDMGGQQTTHRTHHLRNRHTKSVVDGALFSLQACPPKTRVTITLWLHDESDDGELGREFIQFVVDRIDAGLTFGGNSARGIGFAKLDGEATHMQYALSDLQQHGKYLDDHLRWRSDSDWAPTGETVSPQTIDQSLLRVTLSLGIPRGQDVLVGDGRGVDHEIEPQRIVAADGKTYWRIPGSTIRGALKSWMTRLAAKDGTHGEVADSFKNQMSGEKKYEITGENLGWCFLPVNDRFPLDDDEESPIECPIAKLFGSLMVAGRIFIPDSITPCRERSNGESGEAQLFDGEQVRKHVAVDRITGGAAESMLFENTVLIHSESLRFDVEILIKKPQEHEIEWLRKTIIALDLGVLRIGSSKSSGRLSLTKPPKVSGASAASLEQIKTTGWNIAQAIEA